MKSSGFLSTGKSASSRLIRMLLISLVTILCCSGLTAQPPANSESVEVSDDVLSQREALERVRARFPGNIISINEVNQDGRVRFRIRIDNEGNIYTVYVDRATGAITRE